MSSIPTTADAIAPVAGRAGPLYPRAGFYFLLLIVVAVAAFWPSYFSRLGQVDPIRHFHGVVATAWLSALVAQGLLVRYRRHAWHRRVGRVAAYGIAPLFVVSGLLIVQSMATGSNPFQAAFGARLAFVDIVANLAFATCVALAIRARRQVQRHARWMACTGLLLLPPALGRLAPLVPAITSFDAAFHAAFMATEALLLVLLLDDWRSGQRLAPYRALLAVTLVQHAGFAFIDRWAGWQAFVHAVGRLGA